MVRINKKGLTLVELIAVLIVLILIFLLAINKVNNISNETEKKAVKGDAISYVKAVNDYFSLQNGLELFPVYEGFYDVDSINEIGIKVDGTKPTAGYLINLGNNTRYACLKYKERRAIVENNVVTKVDTGKCSLEFKNGYNKNTGMFNANYTGTEVTFTIPKSGEYFVEAWGAQGGDAQDYVGGYGGYSKGYVQLTEGDTLYINVGGKGKTVSKNSTTTGGYNGGGNISTCKWTSSTSTEYCGSGGGATHVAFVSGLLSTLSSSVDDILIVAGGGGGAQHVDYGSNYMYVNGGSGGGSTGGNYTSDFVGLGGISKFFPPTQNSFGTIQYSTNSSYSGSFGKGSNSPESGGGGGFYGGAGTHGGSGGGSGYVGDSRLTNKVMYCYNCDADDKQQSRTVNTDKYSELAISNTAKAGNGYVRLIFVEAADSSDSVFRYGFTGEQQVFTAPQDGTYKIEVWGAQGGSASQDYIGGYGGYSYGNITLSKSDKLYINVGGHGDICNGSSCTVSGGYNGGGSSKSFSACSSSNHNPTVGSGGGATSVATSPGLLSALKEDRNSVVIVAGGGGGSNYCNNVNYASGGYGGGFTGGASVDKGASDWSTNGGTLALGGTQDSGYDFGLGQGSGGSEYIGAGGGYYGGVGSGINGAGGGSGYVSSSLNSKGMSCFECTESTTPSIFTKSVDCVNSSAKKDCAKKGDGYAIITFVE